MIRVKRGLLAVLAAALAWSAAPAQGATISITALPSSTWVYQNTPTVTQYRHWRPMTISVTHDPFGNTSYALTLTQTGSGVVTMTTSSPFTGSGTVQPLVGGLRQSDFVSGTGICVVHVTVSGNIGGVGQVAVPIMVRQLGDINGDGSVTSADRDLLDKRLDGLPTGLTDDAFDLTGDGKVTTYDRVVLNQILNGQLNDQSPYSVYAQWSNGPSISPSYFPIGCWLQSSWRASMYKAAGFNLYLAYWGDPVASDMQDLQAAGMQLICFQDAASLALAAAYPGVIIGWMQQDEPDNAQGSGPYTPPVATSSIISIYQNIRATDPTRPVYLGCGQAVAYWQYTGRGSWGWDRPQDYPYYLNGYYAGCDIASYDIYPMNNSDPTTGGNPWFVAFGVDNLVAWTNSRTQVVWNDLECTNISTSALGPTPLETKAEVWMSLVHGSKGIMYFPDSWYPSFNEAALLYNNPDMLAMVTAVNLQIQQLAPVLNCPSVAVSLSPSVVPTGTYPVDYMVKQYAGSTYLFAVEMRNGSATPTFTVPGLTQPATAQVLGESRSLPVTGSGGVFQFQDSFSPYAVHLYQITPNSH